MADQRYRVVERLEAGGMAEVFLGEVVGMQGFKKRVAIKRVLPHLAQNKAFMGMFLDEARLGARLDHANIVSVFDIGAADNTYFLVMEYVDGCNLKTLMEGVRKQGRHFPLGPAIFIAQEACRGLSYAHELVDDEGRPLGIVHRDISPPNILISRRGEVKVTDFGLAKAATQLEKTDPGVVKGKFGYLSPEAAMGEEVDARADVFALGVVLWEMLAGRRLFLGETDYHTVKLVQAAEVPSLAPFHPDVDEAFEAVLRKALARDRRDRYQTAREMGDALASYLFSRQLKVTSYDVAGLVKQVLSDKARAKRLQRAEPSIIDRLIQEELLRFTSLDDLSDPLDPGAQPLSPEAVADGAAPLDAGAFEDPSRWFDEGEDEAQEPALGELAGSLPFGEDEAPREGASVAGGEAPAPSPSPAPASEATTTRAAVDDGAAASAGPGTPPAERGGGGLWKVALLLAVVVAAGAAAWFTGILPR